MHLFHDWREIFPYQPRLGQSEMMDFVRKKLLNGHHLAIEAQNGWGKTITALVAALSTNRDRVIMCTRTHEQVSHIVDEVRAINRNGHNFRCTVLGAKRRLCNNPWCQGYSTIKCSDYLQKEGNSYFCIFDQVNRDSKELFIPEKLPRDIPLILDLETCKETGYHEELCPYHLAKVAAGVSDIVITPYNFVFSIPQRSSFGLDISDAVIVVDEAHNLPSACRSLNTGAITLENLRDFIARVRNVASPNVLINLLKLRSWFENFPRNMSEELRSAMTSGFVYGSELLRELYKNGINKKYMIALLRLFEEVSMSHDIYSFISLLFLTDPEKGIAYKMGDTLKYTLLDVKDAVADIEQHHSSFLFMSGTLSPIDSFTKELGLNLEYKAFGNILSKNRFKVELIGKVGEVSITTRNDSRYNEDTILWYGNIISELIECIPNGSIIMFPSYRLKETMITNWGINGIVEGNGNKKYFSNGIPLYNESQEYDGKEMLKNYKRNARVRQTALSCVFRGKITEGTDLPYDLCRGIFVIGIPFSNWGSPVIQGIIGYYDKTINKGAGDAWYMYNALTAVNQGIGRGIRDPERDYCAAFLLDNRYIYRQAEIYNKLSDWIRHNVVNKSGSTLEEAKRRTLTFFQELKTD